MTIEHLINVYTEAKLKDDTITNYNIKISGMILNILQDLKCKFNNEVCPDMFFKLKDLLYLTGTINHKVSGTIKKHYDFLLKVWREDLEK